MSPTRGTLRAPAPTARDDAPVGVLVVDDQLVFRQAAREVIEATPNFEILGEASSGQHALAAANELSPDLILLDVRMPDMDGIETAGRLAVLHPEAVVVLITIDDPPCVPDGLVSSGAVEIVRKQDFGSALLRRVWQTHGHGMGA